MDISTFGIMRSGIHIVHSWLISKYPDMSVLYYNNIRNPYDLTDRLVTAKDSRVQAISRKLTASHLESLLVLKSYESKPLDLPRPLCSKNVLVVRNPYNNLASSIAYHEKNGTCKDIRIDNSFKSLWKQYAKEFLNITQLLGSNKVVILYDYFISSKKYRQMKSEELGLNPDLDYLNTIYMGGGSSFTNDDKTYAQRYFNYMKHPAMIALFNDKIVTDYWKKILEIEYNYLVKNKFI